MSLLARARVSDGGLRALWISAAAVVFGSGIWGTHFVAMLAYMPGLPVGYDLGLTSLSIVIAVLLSAAGFALALRNRFSALGLSISGAAIGAMHYIGMAALQGPFQQVWDAKYVFASILIGIGFAAAAGQSIIGVRKQLPARAIAALMLTLGICGMHFTGMAALALRPDPTIPYGDAVLDPASLGIAVAAVAVLIVVLGFVGAFLDSHLASRAAIEAERLRAHIVELEVTKAELEVTTEDLRAALASAAVANQAKSQFLATMSHELRTPLNAVIGFSGIMESEIFGPLGDRRYREYVQDIRASGSHLLALISDILDLSRLDVGQIELHEEDLDLPELISETVRMMNGHADAGELRLASKVEPGLRVRADRRRLRQVLINLLSNAIKFTPPKGEIAISGFRHGSEIAICVRDSGIGIAKEDLPRTFERFSQIDSALCRKYEGAGLGLAISKKLVEAHGGQIELQSELNIGTVVTVILPAECILERQLCAA